MSELVFNNVEISYQMKDSSFVAVKDLDFSIEKGEFVSIIGTSGCGKTTTLYAVAGLNNTSKGQILLNDELIVGPGADRAMVFQNDSVFPWLTVYNNVAYGLKLKKMNTREIDDIVSHYLNLVGLYKAKDKYPRELSGGMKKRVDLARAFANDPKILLMDEPFGALDTMTKEALQMSILKLWEDSRKTILFITHDIEEAIFLSQRIIVLTNSPGTIKKTLNIPFTTPRQKSLKLNNKFQEIRAELINEFFVDKE